MSRFIPISVQPSIHKSINLQLLELIYLLQIAMVYNCIIFLLIYWQLTLILVLTTE